MQKIRFADFLKIQCDEIDTLLKVKNEGDDLPTFRYHAFILIAISIEMMGALYDNHDWHVIGNGRKRFESALKNLNSLSRYQGRSAYNNLRCGGAHVYIPNKELALFWEEEKKNDDGTTIESSHLKTTTILGRAVTPINIREFFIDYSQACDDIIKGIDTNSPELGTKAFNILLQTNS
jgi:hypothetical protein